jgi:hypothetical protein
MPQPTRSPRYGDGVAYSLRVYGLQGLAALDIDQATATALGFPKLKYAWVERERRWICAEIPMDRVSRSEDIVDLYVTGTHLRLREAVPHDGAPPMRRLGRKADVSPTTRLLTSLYLSADEFALFADLPGASLRKTRHFLYAPKGVVLSIDRFSGPLEGLFMAEAEFDDDDAMAAFPMPDFAVREVTDDPRYGGGRLATNGLPSITE